MTSTSTQHRLPALVPSSDVLGVYLLRQRLSGFPAWSPRMHSRIALHRKSEERATVYDALPVSPRSIHTVSRMLSLQQVGSVVRERRVRWPLKYASSSFLGSAVVDLQDIRAFNENWGDMPFHLLDNNCGTYTDALRMFLLGARGQ